MTSPVDIANAAIANVGGANLVSSIDPPDGSVEAGHCATFYPRARTRMLEAVKPSFAQRRARLALSSTNDSEVWAYAYVRPSDCLKPLRVLDGVTASLIDSTGFISAVTPVLGDERDSAPFQLEGEVIYSNEPDAVLVYVFDQVDTTRWTPLFVECVEALLASYLAGVLIKGREGANIGMAWRQSAYQLAASAATSLANSASESAEHVPAPLRARV